MIIKELKLYTNQLKVQKEFYTKTLGFNQQSGSENHFSVKTGETLLTFEFHPKRHHYHYCFLIPCNQLEKSREWLEARTELIEIEKGRYVQDYPNWNARSIYFWDHSGNVAEFIIHRDLKNIRTESFDQNAFLCVNEIGVPTSDIESLNDQLEKNLNTPFWSGNFERFGTNGGPRGMFLLVNYHIKTTWFPTDLRTKPTPFKARIQQDGNTHTIQYHADETLEFGH